MAAAPTPGPIPYDFNKLFYFSTQQSLTGLKQVLDSINSTVPISFTLTRDKFSANAQSPFPIYNSAVFIIPKFMPLDPAYASP